MRDEPAWRSYTSEDGKDYEPYIIHRAPLGTHERFLAFLIEHFGGAFPTWMAPVQVRLIPAAESFLEYAHHLKTKLTQSGFRVLLDDSSDSFGKKIRNAVTKKTPNMLILGDKEQSSQSVTWRRYCTKVQTTLPFEAFLESIKDSKARRVMDNFEDEPVTGWANPEEDA